ncbi:MAG: hypothetical protein IKQ39_04570 [Oscillospiraceae bacterium]|nr:hypothetical protein [Oscillospiraceae bacterium]
MQEIVLNIRKRIAAPRGMPQIICGNSDTVLRCITDSEWVDYPDKTVLLQFMQNGAPCCIAVPFTGNVCMLPALSGIHEVRIGIAAGDIRTAAPARIPCLCCITDLPAHEAPERHDLFAALTAQVNRILNDLRPQEVYNG